MSKIVLSHGSLLSSLTAPLRYDSHPDRMLRRPDAITVAQVTAAAARNLDDYDDLYEWLSDHCSKFDAGYFLREFRNSR
jgi:hypothetical protein